MTRRSIRAMATTVLTGALTGVAALALVTGCSSDTSGKGANAGVFGGSGAPTSTSAPSSPAGGGGGSTSGGSGGGSTSAFCEDWKSLGTPSFNPNAGNLQDELAKFRKAAADAPADIKHDMDQLVAVINGLASGNPDASKSQDYAGAVQRIVLYIAQHCR